jgi:hypothetical protein
MKIRPIMIVFLFTTVLTSTLAIVDRLTEPPGDDFLDALIFFLLFGCIISFISAIVEGFKEEKSSPKVNKIGK